MAFPGTYTTFKAVAPIAYHAVPSEGSSNVTGSCTTCGSPAAVGAGICAGWGCAAGCGAGCGAACAGCSAGCMGGGGACAGCSAGGGAGGCARANVESGPEPSSDTTTANAIDRVASLIG